MKKLIAFFLALAILFAFAGCRKTKNVNVEADESQKIDVSKYTEIDSSISVEELSLQYSKDVQKRLKKVSDDTDFNKEEEVSDLEIFLDSDFSDYSFVKVNSYSSFYNEISEYCFPILYRVNDSVILVYTSDDSDSVYVVDPNSVLDLNTNCLESLHYEVEDFEKEEIIYASLYCKVVYCQETGDISIYRFGETVETAKVPSGSVYAGTSFWVGSIFRSGSDVYAFRGPGSTFAEKDIEHKYDSYGDVSCIAHGVRYVIKADYKLGSDPWSQPLFLMEDGTLKAYVAFSDTEDAAVDSPEHLVEPYYEGGYDR